jgi:hypothetical protein
MFCVYILTLTVCLQGILILIFFAKASEKFKPATFPNLGPDLHIFLSNFFEMSNDPVAFNITLFACLVIMDTAIDMYVP